MDTQATSFNATIDLTIPAIDRNNKVIPHSKLVWLLEETQDRLADLFGTLERSEVCTIQRLENGKTVWANGYRFTAIWSVPSSSIKHNSAEYKEYVATFEAVKEIAKMLRYALRQNSTLLRINYVNGYWLVD